MKAQLVESNTARLEAIERGEQIVVGVNRFTETEPSPLTAGEDAILTVSARGRGGADRAAQGLARRARCRGRRGRARRPATRRRATAATSCRPRSPAPRPASPPANGARRCARPSANTARRPASARAARNDVQGLDDLRADVDRVVRASSDGASSSWSASPASTAIPTAPSRSRCAPATPAWTWSMTASA